MIPLYRCCACPHLLQLAANSSQLGPSPKTRLQSNKSSCPEIPGRLCASRVGGENTVCRAIFGTHIKILFAVYLKFKYNWAFFFHLLNFYLLKLPGPTLLPGPQTNDCPV